MSTDPEFVPKAADVVGLYLNPPYNAIVISVDEKPSIQAKTCPTGYVKTESGKIVRGFKSTYKRNGTLNLFAALEVATGVVHGKTTETKRRDDFRQFMDEVIMELPQDKEIHVILDNLNTHTPARFTTPGLRPKHLRLPNALSCTTHPSMGVG